MAELEPEEERRGGRPPKVTLAAAGIATLLGAVALSRMSARVRLQAHAAALEQMAGEIGATFCPAQPEAPQGADFPALAGTYSGRTVHIDTEVAGTSLHYQFLTRATAEHHARVDGFVIIRRETLLTRMADHLGLADVQVGEPAFDDRFEVTSDLPDAAKLLQPEVRDALLTASFESFVIRQEEVTVRQRGPVADKEMLRRSLQLAVDVAEWLEMLE